MPKHLEIREVNFLEKSSGEEKFFISEKSSLTTRGFDSSIHSFSIAKPLKSLSPCLNNDSKVEINKDFPNLLGRAKKYLRLLEASS